MKNISYISKVIKNSPLKQKTVMNKLINTEKLNKSIEEVLNKPCNFEILKKYNLEKDIPYLIQSLLPNYSDLYQEWGEEILYNEFISEYTKNQLKNNLEVSK